ncbi:MAG: ring,2-phenylacetyl-CoA epoxidase subunit PaaD [Pseudonocardiales bacterium]|jgi:ring-1,2-phenylacetyl-CoA epoxidase subunit PaaD|nr:ring,2-phenylacetyl-CoA epoxidase subunit PaaD [Pseudonocardiales bacterium]
MISTVQDRALRSRIDLVEDPEIPVTLTDLGVVRAVDVASDAVTVTLRPTRLACPAREEMARRVRAAVADVTPDVEVAIVWEMSTWEASDVSAAGGRALLEIGYGDPAQPLARCPYCASDEVRRESAFGGGVCKSPYSCRTCGSTFDVLKNTPAEKADR